MIRLFKYTIVTLFIFTLFISFSKNARAGVALDMIWCIDGTGSILLAGHTAETDALAFAIANQLPINSTLRITVLQFGEFEDNSTSFVVTGPDVLDSQGDADSAASDVSNAVWGGAGAFTNIEDCIELACTHISGSANESVLNIITDGDPNSGVTSAAALKAIANGGSCQFDELNAIGIQSFDQGFLEALVFPAPPDDDADGFFLDASDIENDLPGAIALKIALELATGACCTEFESSDACVEPETQEECENRGGNPFYLGDASTCEQDRGNCFEEQPPENTVIIPTMGQWGMLLAAVVLGIFAIIRLRSIKDSELS